MSTPFTIRWHSRAGQGAITVSSALAKILGENGKFVQSFPVFGAEKRGAPVVVFNRISDEKINDVSHPTILNSIILLDTSLVSSGEISVKRVLSGLTPSGFFLANTSQTSLRIGKDLRNIFAINASKIANAEIGRDIPNVPILGAFLKITKFMNLDKFSSCLGEYLAQNLSAKIVTGNLRAFERGFHEVQKI